MYSRVCLNRKVCRIFIWDILSEQRKTQQCRVSHWYPDVEPGLSELKRDGWFGVFGIRKQQGAGFKKQEGT